MEERSQLLYIEKRIEDSLREGRVNDIQQIGKDITVRRDVLQRLSTVSDQALSLSEEVLSRHFKPLL